MNDPAKRKQINFRIDEDFADAVGRLQSRVPGIKPTVSDVIRQAVMEKDARERGEASKRAARR